MGGKAPDVLRDERRDTGQDGLEFGLAGNIARFRRPRAEPAETALGD